MKISLGKFGTILVSRPTGREAFTAFQSQLADLDENEKLKLDFDGVTTLSPGWADEFITPLLDQLGEHLILLPSDNLSVQATLRILQEANKKEFKFG